MHFLFLFAYELAESLIACLVVVIRQVNSKLMYKVLLSHDAEKKKTEIDIGSISYRKKHNC